MRTVVGRALRLLGLAAVAAGVMGAQPTVTRAPNPQGRIPILEWHIIGDRDGEYRVSRERFRRELELLHARGYVPISLADLLDGRIDIPAGTSPVLFTFDDASPGQFRYLEQDGQLVVDPTSGVGILMDFIKTHPTWKPRGVFCVLPAASAGHAFFGDKGIDGQRTAWRFAKLQWLVAQGFELCNHTLYHARLDRLPAAGVQEHIARATLAIDSAVPGYRVRGFALPLGMWPTDRSLTVRGAWTDPKTNRTTRYAHDAVFRVAGGPARSPFDPAFDPLSLPRVPLDGTVQLETTLDQLDRPGPTARYVAGGDPPRAQRR